jgi:hypothetical protein
MTYAEWRAAVLVEMRRRGVKSPEESLLAREKGSTTFLRCQCENCLDAKPGYVSTQRLWELGETPEQFVAQERM